MDKKLREKILFPLFDILLNGFNYGFHIYASWYLIKESYAVLNAYLALVAIFMVVGIALQFHSAKTTSGVNLHESFIVLPNPLLIISIPLLVLLLSSPWLSLFLKGSVFNLVLVVAIVICHSQLSSARGILQGQGEFKKLNISFYIEVVVKVLLLYILLPKYPGVSTPLLCILLGYVLSLLHIFITLKSRIRKLRFSSLNNLFSDRYLIIFILSQFLIYSFFSLDMILINGLHSDFAPDYAVLQKVGMIQFFVGSSMMSVFLPELSDRSIGRVGFKKKWIFFLLILLGVLIIAQIFYNTLLPFLIPILFGEKYASMAQYVPYGGLLFAILVILNFFITSQLALGNWKFLLLLLTGLILVSLSIFIFDSIVSIIVAEIIIYLLVSIGLYIIIFRELKNE